MTHQPIDKELIKKFLKGDASREEIIRVNLFMQQPGAQSVFDEAWEDTDPEMLQATAKADRASLQSRRWYNEALQRIKKQEAPETPLYFFSNVFYRYAAACLVFLMLGIGTYTVLTTGQDTNTAVAMLTVSNPKGKNTLQTLPDGSKVWLGAGSTLSYPKAFEGDTRELSLTGEAFFDVVKNPDKPFIIHTGNVQTKVLGTSFKITAFEGQAPNVAVSTGKVRVEQNRNGGVRELALLLPGQQVTWKAKENKAVKQAIDKNEVLEWKTGKQAFHDVALGDISNALERWYGVKIIILKPELSNLRLYTTLNNTMPMDKALDVLAAIGDFQYNIKGSNVEIY